MNWNRIFSQTVFYPTLGWALLLCNVFGVRRWWDAIDEHVILGAYPFPSYVAKLSQLGVKAVVNTCDEYAGPQAEYERYGIAQIHIPTIDFTHPKYDDVRRAVDFMDEQISQGKTVYVHCKAGRARSATVCICWLMKNKGMTSAEAQAFLLEKRSHVNPRLPSRPVVQQFEQWLSESQS